MSLKSFSLLFALYRAPDVGGARLGHLALQSWIGRTSLHGGPNNDCFSPVNQACNSASAMPCSPCTV